MSEWTWADENVPTCDDTRPKVTFQLRGKGRFVLEGEGCEEWIEIDEPVENKQ